MVVADDVLPLLAPVLDHLMVEEIWGDGLLIDNIPTVFFISEDVVNAPYWPHLKALHGRHLGGGQHSGDFFHRYPVKVVGVDESHGISLVRHNEHIPFLIGVIAEQGPGRSKRHAFGKTPLVRPFDGLRLVFRLTLCNAAQQGKHGVNAPIQCVQMLVLKEDSNWRVEFLKLPDVGQAIEGVPRKAADVLRDDEVDSSLLASLDHLLELFPLGDTRTRNALVCKSAYILPAGVVLDVILIILHLQLVAPGLAGLVGADAAVSSHTQHPWHLRLKIISRWYDFDLHLARERLLDLFAYCVLSLLLGRPCGLPLLFPFHSITSLPAYKPMRRGAKMRLFIILDGREGGLPQKKKSRFHGLRSFDFL